MYSLNLLNFIFISFSIVIVLFGSLMNMIEPYLPIFIKQSFLYGKMAHRGEKDPFTSMLEIPKSWFRHFYVFALVWSIGWSCFSILTFIMNIQPPGIIFQFLDLMTGARSRAVEVNSTECFVAMVLITLQCVRRWYETHFIQIFSSSSKINLLHYIVGYFHYFATITGIVSNAEGFVGGSTPRNVQLSELSAAQIFGVGLFIYSWLQQYQSNMVLVKLRKDKSGKVVTEKHMLPEGGWFELVSSPHMLFEILMYVALFILMPNCITIRYAAIWVAVNQVQTAWLTHKWYKETFTSKYPTKRKAILPGLL